MKTPILIPAYNEEKNIGRILDALPYREVEPIVIVNGSVDRTADIAEDFGAKVITIGEQGKLPAIQYGLKDLGKKALEPLIILDGDTTPLFPRLWHKTMINNLKAPQERPSAVGGPVWFTDDDLLSCTIRSFRRAQRAFTSQHSSGTEIGQIGPNMAMNIQNQTTLDEIITLPHYWPGEDRALVDIIMNNNGSFEQPLSPYALAFTPTSESYLSLSERKSIGIKEARKRVLASYRARGASGSTPYDRFE